jgi:hypothetical protein
MMIRHRGFSFEMPLDREIVRVGQFMKQLEDTKPVVLKAMGVQAVSWVVQDYRARSDGRGAGGITWRPITDGAIRTRLAGRAPWRNQRSQLESIKGDYSNKAKKKRQSIRENRKKTIAKELGAARIGVDTGRLVNSLVYGVADLNKVRVGVKLQGSVPRAAFDVSGNEIRIGSNMQYAGYFDQDRPIFGDGFLDEGRKKILDTVIEKTVDAHFKRKFGGQG